MKLRSKARTFVISAVAIGGTVVGMSGASAAGPYFTIFSYNNGKCLTPYGGSSSNGANIVQWDCSNSGTQLWWQDSQGRIVNKNGKCMTTYGGSKNDGANIVQWDCNSSSVHVNGFGAMVTAANKCIRPYGGSKNNGANQTQWECSAP
ncbi:RICIN domain-containing protein [Streptomyces sp. NPDC001941]|uniref:RICIN domain-containing protein n=1 Tax=Streptomyces sp. NPDC001941 TaxID=3154659 RepID=UPI003328720D